MAPPGGAEAGSRGRGSYSGGGSASAGSVGAAGDGGQPGRGDVGGAGGVAEEHVAMRRRPQIGAGLEQLVAPGGVGLQAVVMSTQRRDIARARRPTLVVGDGVVVVAAAGGADAPREHAAEIPESNTFSEAVGDLVGIDPDVVGQVDHRLHRQRGAGVAAPGPDRLRGDRAPGVLTPPHLPHRGRQRVLRQMDVEGHGAAVSRRSLRSLLNQPGGVAVPRVGGEGQRQLVAGDLARGRRHGGRPTCRPTRRA